MQEYLEPTAVIDSDNESIQETARQVTEGCTNDVDKAIKLFYFVRGKFRYNIFVPRSRPEDFRAGAILERGEGFCIPKAVLLVALCRAVGIPGRLGFAAIRNHLLPETLSSVLKTNEIPDHGYSQLLLEDKWVKATPAFDIETCHEKRFLPVEFDGTQDATFHPHDQDGRPHIEYIRDLGSYDDLPFDEITAWVIPALTPEALEMFLGGQSPVVKGDE